LPIHQEKKAVITDSKAYQNILSSPYLQKFVWVNSGCMDVWVDDRK